VFAATLRAKVSVTILAMPNWLNISLGPSN
jgi:hypothetical protein